MDLPMILAGPIIRRVEKHQVYLWMATSNRHPIDAEFYQIYTNESPYSYKKIPIQTDVQSIRLGQCLFVHLIKVTPVRNSFPTEILIGYNLFFKKALQTFSLLDFGMLDSDHPSSIVYPPFHFPTFIIQENEANSFLYGSCRKLHGKGEDSLACGDDVLEEKCMDITQRPNSLFLLGDQVYSDDIPDPMIRVISQLSKELMGKEEDLSLVDPRIGKEPFQTNLQQIHGRQYISENFAEITSRHAHNHVMTFGEYAVLYLLGWGQELWDYAHQKGLFSSFEEELASGHIHFVYHNHSPYQKEYQKELQQHQIRFEEQLEDIGEFRHSLPKVRRLLANIPTYMIFDDHEITDDWNLTSNWKKHVRNAPLGKHIVSNGLCAYWIFQAWGNDPEPFSSEFIQIMSFYLRRKDPTAPFYESWSEFLWKFQDWGFVAPTNPRAVFLNTRTMREYDPEPRPTSMGKVISESNSSPILINDSEWKRTEQRLLHSGWKKGEKLIIIAPSPLYGVDLYENLLHQYVYPFEVFGFPVETSFDYEMWKYNLKGVQSFLERVQKWEPKDCFLLSGDLHFASAVKAQIKFKEKEPFTIHQYTSSPLKNRSFNGLYGFLFTLSMEWKAKKKMKNTIEKFCNPTTQVIYEDETNGFVWKELLDYLQVGEKGAVDVDNNVGLLTTDYSHYIYKKKDHQTIKIKTKN
ncbi:hypothetical protein RZN22_04085 [Bacillaceae bacterium S4-13-58]